MYSEQLEKLIKIALGDGKLSDKNKLILFKRAEAEGIDLDEFEMVLDARVQEVGGSLLGKVSAIPVDSFENKAVHKLTPINELLRQLDDVEDKYNEQFQLELEKRHKSRNSLSAKNIANVVIDFIPGSSIYSMGKELISGPELTDEEKDAELRQDYREKIVEKKNEVILNFSVPRTQEEILEFLSISVSNYRSKINQENGLSGAWKNKSVQIISALRQGYALDGATKYEIERYEKELTSFKNVAIGGFRKLFKK